LRSNTTLRLVAVESRKIESVALLALSVDERRPLPDGLSAGRLDLDDVGTPIGEQHRREGSNSEVAQLEHPHPIERPVGACRTFAPQRRV
jgi:hypothetical protein